MLVVVPNSYPSARPRFYRRRYPAFYGLGDTATTGNPAASIAVVSLLVAVAGATIWVYAKS